MAYINFQPSDFFNTVLYTGNGTNPRSLTGVGFQPDFTWIKNRTDAWGHGLADSTRGGGKTLISNSNAVEQTNYTWGYVNSFDSDGFTITNGGSGDDFVNQTSDNYVSWNWLANGGTTSSNTDGSITSTVQANQTAGFSIVTYTGTGTAGTIGHGLGKKPQCILLKNRSFNDSWITFHEPEGATKFMSLDTTGASSDFGAMWNDTEPTTSVFSIGSDSGGRWVNSSGDTYVAYCFAEVKGYSKFGSYTGNGSTDGTFVYTGFRPAFVLTKRTDSAQNWAMYDNRRNDDAPAGANVIDRLLYPNASDAEVDTGGSLMVDFLSNGFKWRGTSSITNNGASIYMAFAEFPLVGSNGLAGTAR
jgi:hypothetical protein